MKPRIHEIDVVRGVALFGILVVNLPYHALPINVAGGVPALGDHTALAAWSIGRVFFESKFFSQFSLLFGMSLVLQRASLIARYDRWLQPLLRRQAFLLVVGLLHGVFLFGADVLFPYSILGTIALIGFRLQRRAILAIVVGLLVLGAGCLVAGEVTGVMSVERVPAQVAPLAGPLTLNDLMPTDTTPLEAIELRVFREGPLRSALVVRAGTFAIWMVLSTAFADFNARILALMLVGILLMQANVLDDRWQAARRRVCIAGWMIGLPIEIGTAVLVAIEPQRGIVANSAIAVAHFVGSVALAAAYATTLVVWAKSGFLAPLQSWIASAGRMAFTNYLCQSIVANILFSGLGLGWFGEKSLATLLGLSVLIYSAQVIASGLWLARFEMGPFEWVWRFVTHLRRPAFKKRPAGILPAS